jgi:hypothetical protein
MMMIHNLAVLVLKARPNNFPICCSHMHVRGGADSLGLGDVP